MLDARVGDTISAYPQPIRPTGDNGRIQAGPGGPVLMPPDKGGKAPDAGPATRLTVVGIAASVSTPDVAAWMSPADVATLAGDGPPPVRQMIYRIEPSATAADLSRATARITGDLPADAVVTTLTYLETKASVASTADLYVPILLAFSVFALLAAAFTIANVVSGVVLSSYRDIGVMKAIGFTPVQITGTLLGQILLPVTIGAIGGVIAGSLASQPTVANITQSFGLPADFVWSLPVVMAVFAIAVSVALLAAIGPAIHAGRLSAVGAITRGTAPSARPDGGQLRRLGLRLPVAIPVRLGVAAGVAHPGRAAMTLGALLVGVAAVTFSIALNLSLVRAVAQIDRSAASPVRVELRDPQADPADVTSTLARQPEIERLVAIGASEVSVARMGLVPFVGYDGDASWIGFELIRGRWFNGPGEVVAPTAVFAETGLRIGDTVEVTHEGRTITVRLVGETFDGAEESTDHLLLRGTWADLAEVDPGARPTRWEARPTAGVPPADYTATLQTATGGRVVAYAVDDPVTDSGFILFLSVVTFMGIVLVAISLGGVFDTVLLETQQRTREMAILKALGLTPAQVVAMVESTVVPVGIVGGLLGVPLGLLFQRAVLAYMGETAARTGIPESTFDVLAPATLVALSLAGLAIAALGAYLPAQRAARARIAPVLQAE